ncbi:MAG TPA: ribonuclease HII [Candidatus Paceibacterota bacterium]
MKWTHSIGIDEAGRGPLAGPITLAALCCPKEFKGFKFNFPIKDSKQMTLDRRNIVCKILKNLKNKGEINFSVTHIKHTSIDKHGITKCARNGIKRCLKKLEIKPSDTRILLDGTLYAPEEFNNQKTIIRGDEKVKIIALASIIAKVSRDKRMVNLSKKFPQYGFEIHKGYGTKMHKKSIKKHGISMIHRRTFIK